MSLKISMKGIELVYRNQKIMGSIKRGTINIIIGQKLGDSGLTESYLHFTALDTENNEFIDWLKTEVLPENEISIKFTEFKNPSQPISIRKNNIEKLKLEGKLKAYLKLKQELEEEGLI